MTLSKEDAEAIKGLLTTLIEMNIVYGWHSVSGKSTDITILMDKEGWSKIGAYSWFI